MEYQKGRTQFIQSWGELGCKWGICKTMGQIHGLLLISENPLSCDTIMEELEISRGNANMNLRGLIDWGIVYKSQIEGSRKELFHAEKDIWKVFKLIIARRKEKELNPMIEMITELKAVNIQCDKSKELCRVINELDVFSNKANSALDRLINSENNLLMTSIIKMLR